jgi:hypothetical protein
LALAQVREHRVEVAVETLGKRLSGGPNFGKHWIKFHGITAFNSSGVQITGIR